MTCCTHDCNEGRDCPDRCYLQQADGGVRLHTDFSELLDAPKPELSMAALAALHSRIAVAAVLGLVAACAIARACGIPLDLPY